MADDGYDLFWSLCCIYLILNNFIDMPPPLEEMSEQLSLRAKISGKEAIDRPVHAANAATASTTTMTTASSSSSTKAEEASATDKKVWLSMRVVSFSSYSEHLLYHRNTVFLHSQSSSHHS